jgi:phosphoglycerate kinase
MALGKKLTLAELSSKQLSGKRVVIRVDFNVPFGKDGKISNNQRISGSIPTIEDVFKKGANNVVLLSHLGRPDGQPSLKFTLRPVAERLQQLINRPVIFVPESIGAEVDAVVKAPAPGSVILLENVRFHVEEEGSGVDADGKKIKATPEAIEAFSKALSSYGDVYINDAFGTAHRAHVSMVGVKLPIRAAGHLIKTELDAFVPIVESPRRPLLSILGGAKVSDKIKLILNLLDKVNEMILTGGMVYTFLQVGYGVNIGSSLFDDNGASLVEEIFDKARAKGVEIHLAKDFVCGDKAAADAEVRTFTQEQGIPYGWMGLDIGPETVKDYAAAIGKAQSVIWNGPAGMYELEPFQAGTRGILEACAAAKARGALVVIGGGDCGACAAQWGYADKLTHISTGGGASLELLEGKPMPGLLALSDKS